MSSYIVEFKNDGKTVKTEVEAFTSFRAKEMINKKFPKCRIISCTEKEEYTSNSSSSIMNDVVDFAIIETVIETVIGAFGSDSSSASDVGSSLGDFASGIADAFDGGGISDLFD